MAAAEAPADAVGSATAAAPTPTPSAADKAPGVFHSKKTKVLAKSGAAALTQWDILAKSGIAPADIPAFQDSNHWLAYFPPLGQADLTAFGAHVDWRRTFITTSANPYYDSFIRWQFNTLRKRDKIGFGKRPTIYSPTDGQACADHDRSSGEGVGPQEYTLIKLRVKAVPQGHRHAAELAPLQALIDSGKGVFFVAATLRPETMYGQTNCFLLPEGSYGAYVVSASDVFICSERSARNMAFQDLALERGRTQLACGPWTGEALLGLPLAAPYATFPEVYTLPLMTISMGKGTGVVTSVPSDAPDDWAALRDLKEKPKLREKYGISDAMVAMDPVEIIDIPGFGRQAAVKVCDDLKIKSQNDKERLAEAKEKVYLAGFYSGVMLVGSHAGKKVCDAKPLVRAEMLAAGLAASYWEPESLVISRSGDECVVAEVDQWYLKYGEDEWRGAVEAWVRSDAFATYNPMTKQAFLTTLGWLKEWACSRNFGLGTLLPWDPQFVIESLSDSTIYMAYYAIAHLLQGDMQGTKPGALGISPELMTDEAWDYIFLDAAYPAAPAAATLPPEPALAAMRHEFGFWYPLDLRVSGKDLIQNHLTMSLYNHAAIWGAERADRMPQGFFANGHVMVDGEKMSKARGNFILLQDALERWGADATRFALADAGDGLEDANFEQQTADSAVLRLTTEVEFAAEAGALLAKAGGESEGGLRTGPFDYADAVFDAKMDVAIASAAAAYAALRFRDAVQAGVYGLLRDRDTYRDMCEKMGTPMHAAVLRRFLELHILLIAPICPHYAEHGWRTVLGHAEGDGTSVTRAAFPAAKPLNPTLIAQDAYLQAKLHAFRVQITKATFGKPGKAKAGGAAPAAVPTHANIYVASEYAPWQLFALRFLAAAYKPPSPEGDAAAATATAATATPPAAAAAASASAVPSCFPADTLAQIQAAIKAHPDPAMKALTKRIMEFASNTMLAQGTAHADGGPGAPLVPALQLRTPFSEAAVWEGSLPYVRRALGIPNVAVLRVEEPGVVDAADPSARAKDVVPGEPSVFAWAAKQQDAVVAPQAGAPAAAAATV